VKLSFIVDHTLKLNVYIWSLNRQIRNTLQRLIVAAGFRAAILRGHAGGTGCAQMLLQAKGQQRQSLLGNPDSNGQEPPQLHQLTINQQGGGHASGWCHLWT